MTQISPIPTAAELLEEAELEPVKFTLADYWQAILTLRQRNFAWRDVADWFEQRNLPTDHTKIYRFAQKSIPIELGVTPTHLQAEKASEFLTDEVVDLVDSDAVNTAIASTNAYGQWLDTWEVDSVDFSDAAGARIGISFTVEGDQDPDKSYFGTKIVGTAVAIISPDNSVSFTEVEAEKEDIGD